jgi:hypothetical protein
MPRPPTTGPVVVPSTVQVELVWEGGGRTWLTELSGIVAGTITVDQALANSLFTAAKGSFTTSGAEAEFATTTSFTAVRVKDLRTANNAEHESNGAALAGTGAGASASLNDALVVTKRTAQSGKAFRGRMYFAGLAVSALDTTTHWDPAKGQNLVNWCQALLTSWNTNGLQAAVVGKHLMAGTDHAGNVLAERNARSVPITEFDIANSRKDSQRRRLGR